MREQELKELPDFIRKNVENYKTEYLMIPVVEREYIEFGYFVRCKYVTLLRKKI